MAGAVRDVLCHAGGFQGRVINSFAEAAAGIRFPVLVDDKSGCVWVIAAFDIF